MRLTVRVSNIQEPGRAVELSDVLVDPAPVLTLLPAHLMDQLGLRTESEVKGSPSRLRGREQSFAHFEIFGKVSGSTLVIDDVDAPIIGGITLMAVGFEVDKETDTLRDFQALMY